MAAKKRKRRNTARKKKKQKDFAGFYQEIAVLLSFAVCLFLFLSNFRLCGKVGNTVSSALFGVLGGVHEINVPPYIIFSAPFCFVPTL